MGGGGAPRTAASFYSAKLCICYRFVNILTGIGLYMCGKIADILATEKALSVDFILSLIKKNTKTKNSTLRTE